MPASGVIVEWMGVSDRAAGGQQRLAHGFRSYLRRGRRQVSQGQPAIQAVRRWRPRIRLASSRRASSATGLSASDSRWHRFIRSGLIEGSSSMVGSPIALGIVQRRRNAGACCCAPGSWKSLNSAGTVSRLPTDGIGQASGRCVPTGNKTPASVARTAIGIEPAWRRDRRTWHTGGRLPPFGGVGAGAHRAEKSFCDPRR